MRQVLTDPKRLRIFNVVMALLLVMTLYPIAVRLLSCTHAIKFVPKIPFP
jgi:hypothetical protein